MSGPSGGRLLRAVAGGLGLGALGRRDRLLVLAVLVRAHVRRDALRRSLLEQVGRAARRARLVDRLVPRREVAVRVACAAVERAAALRAFDRDLALAALRAGKPHGLLLDVFALRIVRARDELAVA